MAPALLLLGAVVCYSLPDRRRAAARLTALVSAGGFSGLLISVGPLVFPSGRVEHSSGELVSGIALILRIDAPGMAIVLLASVMAVVALLDAGRRPMERGALLLCLFGTGLAALAGNVILLFGGLEAGNIGAVLLGAAGAPRLSRRHRAGFVVQHVAALGLLTAALRLQNEFQTTDLLFLPSRAVGTAVGFAWAATGVVRLLAAPGLSGGAGGACSTAWTAVAAVPTGLIVMVRLLQMGGGDLPDAVGPFLIVVGLGITAAGAAEALRTVRVPAAAGRALCVALAGPVVLSAGVGGGRALGAFAATGFALCIALASAPAWDGGARAPAGRRARWLRAAALAGAGGVPFGYGMVGLLLTADSVVTLGPMAALLTIAFGAAVLSMVCAGTGAARAALADTGVGEGTGASPPIRRDALAAVCFGVVAGAAPGLVQTLFVRGVAGDAGTAAAAVDLLAVRGAGGGWPAGYLAVGVVVAVTMAGAVAVLLERTTVTGDAGAASPARVRPPLWWPAQRRLAGLPPRLDAGLRWFDRADGWAVSQPGLAAVLVAALVLLWAFR